MDFSLMNPSIHNKIKASIMNFQPHTFLHQQTSESSDSELSAAGRIPPPPPAPFQASYSITAPPNSNIHETRFALLPHNMESSIGMNPCTSFSLQNIDGDSTAAMRETIFRMATMQPIDIEPEESPVKAPRRRNVRISKDPQSVAARHRRERISRRIRTLQRMVPGGAKLDTASMLEEAAHYLKFLKKQLQSLEQAAARSGEAAMGARLFPAAVSAVQMLC